MTSADKAAPQGAPKAEAVPVALVELPDDGELAAWLRAAADLRGGSSRRAEVCTRAAHLLENAYLFASKVCKQTATCPAQPAPNPCKLTECQGKPACGTCLAMRAQPAPSGELPALTDEPIGTLLRGSGGAFKLRLTDNIEAVYALPEGEHKLYARAAIAAAQVPQCTAGMRDVIAERRRQVEVEGWTPEHDDTHAAGELARAAAVYANPEIWNILGAGLVGWPWSPAWYKPSNPRHDLVKATALLLAEIERLDRSAAPKPEGSAT